SKITHPKQINLKETASVLVVMPFTAGDFILATPAIGALKEAMPPEGRITALISEETRNLARACACFDEGRIIKSANPGSLISAAAAVISRRYGLFINMEGDTGSSVMAAILSAAKARIAYDRKSDSRFYNALHNLRLHTLDSPQHKIVRYLNLVRFIGANSYDFMPRIKLSEEDKQYAAEFVEKNGISKGDTVIGVHPVLKNPGKRWAMNKFSQLVENLEEKCGVKVVVFHHRDEKARFKEFMHVARKTQTIAADTYDYLKLAAISTYFTCFICNETDFMHLLAPFTNLVVIWGEGDPETNRPMGVSHDIIQSADGIADTVPVSRVTEAVRKYLNSPPPK
ncbi:MAG TPA: lipopolysaccharide heptosyltransferase family protein, partial [bacterium]|nr:lipopolysaccharide heptosyltransferase family protein [bacterium]